MSQEAKRVWTACVWGCAALAAFGLVAGSLVWQGGVRPAVAAEPAAGPGGTLLDPVRHAGVSELRGRVRLSDDALAAMACSQASAETILGKLPTWWGTNRVAWLARREAVAGARARLRRAERTARTGPRNPKLLATLPSLRKAVADAKQAEAQLVATAVAQVEALLTASQRQTWATVRTNPLGGEYACAASLSAAQVKAIQAAQRALTRAHAVGKTVAAAAERGTSQFLCGEFPCMRGVLDRAGPCRVSRWRRDRCCLRL